MTVPALVIESFIKVMEDMDDVVTRLVYADWLDDHGQPYEAQAWRTVVGKGWRPCDLTTAVYSPAWVWFNETNSSSRCGWFQRAEETKISTGSTVLPRHVFRHLKSPMDCSGTGGQGYWEARHAEDDLVTALVGLFKEGGVV